MAPAGADPPPSTGAGAVGERPNSEYPDAEGSGGVAAGAKRPVAVQDGPDAEPPVSFHFRLRGRFLADADEFADIRTQRVSVWTDTRIGEKLQVRGTWDLGETRIHDLWVQFDTGRGVRLRAGRSAPLWLAEFTDAPFGFQMISAANGAALTEIRETGVFLFADRGPYHLRVHLVNGSGWATDENSWKDLVASGGRDFVAGGASWTLDAGHYEGRDGPDGGLVPKRQTAVHLDGGLGSGHFVRASAFRREQDGREHFGGFVRFRKRFPQGVWGAAAFETESNRGPAESPGHASSFVVGTRYELPWTLSHLSADYRRRFGATSDHQVLVALQWVLDFRDPARN